MREPETLKEGENQYLPTVMEEMKVRDVAIPHTTNVTSSTQKSVRGGRFQLKYNMVQLLYTNKLFTGLSYEDPRVLI